MITADRKVRPLLEVPRPRPARAPALRPNMVQNLPDELWLDIFGMAVDDADFFEPILPTAFSNSVWFKTLYGDWSLRSAQEEVNNAQRRSYATKKVRDASFQPGADPDERPIGHSGHL